jgi:hypothetical protein
MRRIYPPFLPAREDAPGRGVRFYESPREGVECSTDNGPTSVLSYHDFRSGLVAEEGSLYINSMDTFQLLDAGCQKPELKASRKHMRDPLSRIFPKAPTPALATI